MITDPEFIVGRSDIVTLAYASATGNLLWSDIRGRPGADETPVSIDYASDGSGSDRVVVCGTRTVSEGQADLLCMAFAA